MRAQWNAPFSQYWTVKNYFNPSFAGETDKIQLSGIYKYQWAGINNAPKHFILSAEMPVEFLGKRHGVALLTGNHSIGNERNSIFAAQYTFKQEIGPGTLNIGVQAGMRELNFDAASVRLTVDSVQQKRETIDASPTDKKTIDLNAGISWITNGFYIGAAATHINQPSFYSMKNLTGSGNSVNDSVFSKIPLSYNFMTGCNITVFHPLFEIQPMLLMHTTDLKEIHVQTALRVIYGKRYSMGASRNGKTGYSFFAGVVIREIEFGYAYDLSMSEIGRKSGGSHEASIRYRFPIDFSYRGPQPHKSIRLL